MPVRQLSPLAARRPGHAPMARILDELDRRDLGAVPPDLEPWNVGAWGEIVAGQELATLPDGWHVLHSIPVGRVADIDHLVIGPGGVFVVATKRHRGKRVRIGTHAVWIDGTEVVGYQRDLLSRCTDVRSRLAETSAVRPLIVVVDAAEVRHTGPQTVGSVPLGGLVEHLLAAPVVLDPDRVAALTARAARPETWGRSTRSLIEPDPTARFLGLGRAAGAVRSPAPEEPSRTPVVRLFLAGVVLPAVALVGASWALAEAAQLLAP